MCDIEMDLSSCCHSIFSIPVFIYFLKMQYGPYEDNWDCYRSDETDLTQQWLAQKKKIGKHAAFVMNKPELDQVDLNAVDSLWGLFGPNHMTYDHKRQEDKDPSLSELVEKAITVLQKKDNGFVLLVEAGRIDHGHHEVIVGISTLYYISIFSERYCLGSHCFGWNCGYGYGSRDCNYYPWRQHGRNPCYCNCWSCTHHEYFWICQQGK